MPRDYRTWWRKEIDSLNEIALIQGPWLADRTMDDWNFLPDENEWDYYQEQIWAIKKGLA